MKSYYRIILGKGNAYAAECFAGGFIGANYDIQDDISQKLPEQWREFNKKFIPVLLAQYPEKSKISAGLACGALWTLSKGIKKTDIVLCPDGNGSYRVGEIVGDYYYVAGTDLPHRRRVAWHDAAIPKIAMSEALQHSVGSIAAVCQITGHQVELEQLLNKALTPITIVSNDPEIEDPLAFSMENHLEDFLVKNWDQTTLGSDFTIYEEEGESVGEQYPTDTGPIDILAISKDKKQLLVIELKRGRASDVVVGQILRYIGFVREEIAAEGQSVKGAIIALEDDQKIRRALTTVPFISFFRYQISFKLVKG
jgi:restriction system protein